MPPLPPRPLYGHAIAEDSSNVAIHSRRLDQHINTRGAVHARALNH